MKLLIADDEKLTRVGLYESIPWKELHIDEVYLADDIRLICHDSGKCDPLLLSS